MTITPRTAPERRLEIRAARPSGSAVRPTPRLRGLWLALAFGLPMAAQDPQATGITLRIVDASGRALDAGTELRSRVEWHGDPPSGVSRTFDTVTVGPDGRLTVPVERWWLHRPGHWLHVARTMAGGHRERVFVPLHPDVGTLTLVPEELLASGTLRDGAGATVPVDAITFGVVPLEGGARSASAPGMRDRIAPRFVHGDAGGRFEVWGWRAEGRYALHASWYRGPAAERVPFAFGEEDVTVTLPATGHLQVALRCADPFPERAAFAVVRDLEREGRPLRESLIPRDTTNIRLPTGRHAVTCELNGVPVADLGAVQIGHGEFVRVAVDLRGARVFDVEATDPDGNSIATWLTVVGSPDGPVGSRPVRVGDGFRFRTLIATTAETVDLDVSPVGGTPVRFGGVSGECTIVLRPERR